MNLSQELAVCLRSRIPLIQVISAEEERVQAALVKLCEEQKCQLFAWDHADGFRRLAGEGPPPDRAGDPLSALEAIDRADRRIVFLMRDFHQCWHNQPRIIRKLRNLAHRLKYTRKSILVTSPARSLPEELRDETVVLEMPPPGLQELTSFYRDTEASPLVPQEWLQ